mmetsp:Transcript_64945/g.170034  ORF Transcript_64945/g.170034 Transcript_64945/m.170034 type:complete len:395 (+) Transcript_64945:494-1678(+)
MLVELPEHEVLVLLDGALRGGELAAHQVDQRRLAAPVGPHQRDARVAVDPQVELRVELVLLLAAVREGDVVEREYRGLQLPALLEAEVQRLLAHGGLVHGLVLHLLQHLLLRLSARGHAVGAVHAHEGRQLLDVGLLLVVQLRAHALLVLHDLNERLVVPAVVREPLLGQPDRVGAHRVEEVLGVRDDEEALAVGREVLLEPDAGLQVQVVRRLIQQQEGGGREERLGQGDAHAPASRHVLCLPVHGHEVVGEAQPGEDLPRARLGAGGVELGEAVGDGVDALVARAALLHDLGRERLQALRLRDDVGDDRLHGRLLRGLGLLVEVEDVHVRGQGQVPLRDRRKDVALAAAVVADEAVAAALVQLDVAVVHERLPAHLHAEVLELHVALGLGRG